MKKSFYQVVCAQQLSQIQSFMGEPGTQTGPSKGRVLPPVTSGPSTVCFSMEQ